MSSTSHSLIKYTNSYSKINLPINRVRLHNAPDESSNMQFVLSGRTINEGSIIEIHIHNAYRPFLVTENYEVEEQVLYEIPLRGSLTQFTSYPARWPDEAPEIDEEPEY